jgi:hypothetical protein
MARRKRKRRGVRARKHVIKLDPESTTYRQKIWAIVRSVRMGTELGKQNLVEDNLLDYLQEQGAPSALIDYYLGYAKRAEKLAENFSSSQYEKLLQELRDEAEKRGLDLTLLEACIKSGLAVRSLITDASYYNRAVKGSQEYPEAKGAFASTEDSVALRDPEITPSSIIEGLYFSLYRARILPEDLNNLIAALMHILERTPAVWGSYYPMILQAREVEVPEIEGKIPRPWSVLLKTWTSRDLITAEDWNDLLDIAELLRLYWDPEFPAFQKRNDPGDSLGYEEQIGVAGVIEHILSRIGPPYPKFTPRPVAKKLFLPPSTIYDNPAALSFELLMTETWVYGFPEFELLMKECWNYDPSGPVPLVIAFSEDWGYIEPPSMTQAVVEAWTS